MAGFKELKVWQKAKKLTCDIYTLTEDFPRAEQFGVGLQLRRAAISVMSNVAEGHGRRTNRDFAHFVGMAIGSANEVDSLLELAQAVGLGRTDACEPIMADVEEIRRMLWGLEARLDPAGRDKR